MKIGILTFHIAHNYGAVLQAYGMQQHLRSLGHDASIIDYRPKYLVDCFKVNNWRNWASKNPIKCIQRLINEIHIKSIRKGRWNAFNNFIENKLIKTPSSDSYDLVLIGSDQVWTPFITGGELDPVMFGIGINSKKTISYAASGRRINYADPQTALRLRQYLGRLDGISVREDQLKSELQTYTDKPIAIVQDPVILAGKGAFEGIAKKPEESNYVLTYEINSDITYPIAHHISETLGLSIVKLTAHPSTADPDMRPITSPEEFVGYIKNASYVVTTSFHGLAFSLIFNRPFYAVKQNNDSDVRLCNLLQTADLMDRFIDPDAMPRMSLLDFGNANRLLKLSASESTEYLNKYITPS